MLASGTRAVGPKWGLLLTIIECVEYEDIANGLVVAPHSCYARFLVLIDNFSSTEPFNPVELAQAESKVDITAYCREGLPD